MKRPSRLFFLLILASALLASDESALLEAIRLHPDEDTPRLAYADWLEEHGNSDRAEFIRVQIEKERTPPGLRRLELEDREGKLLEKNLDRWVPPAIRTLCPAFRFRRGFVDKITVGGNRVMNSIDFEDILKTHPMVTDLEIKIGLRPSAEQWRKFVQNPKMRAIRHLSVGYLWNEPAQDAANAVADALADPTSQFRLQSIRFDEIAPSIEHLNPLIRSEALSTLKKLDLRFTAQSATAFAQKNRFQLEELVIQNGTDVDILRPLIDSSHLGSLRRLKLDSRSESSIGESLIALIARAGKWGPLTHLTAKPVGQITSRPFLTREALRLLTSSSVFAELKELDATFEGGHPNGVEELAKLKHLEVLRLWAMWNHHGGDEVAKAIAQMSSAQRLKVLELSRLDIGDEGVKALAESPFLSGLEELNLAQRGDRYGQIGAKGLEFLLRSPHLVRLHTLDLTGSPLGNLQVAAGKGLGNRFSLTHPNLARLSLRTWENVAMDLSFDAWLSQHAALFPNLVEVTGQGTDGKERLFRVQGANLSCVHMVTRFL